jgi:anti-sigma-K factor RskA
VSERSAEYCGGDAAAYVLGALAPDEARAFRHHLESCVVCRDEVEAFERVVDALPAAVEQYRAPAALRGRVLGAAGGQGWAATASAPAIRSRLAARLAGLPARWLAAGAAGLGAAVAAVAIALAGAGGASTHMIAAKVAGPGRAELMMTGGHAELLLRHFPAPPRGEVYEVWIERGNGVPIATRTLFTVTANGDADVGVAGPMSGVTKVMVTPERAGGTRIPSHPPVVVARVD